MRANATVRIFFKDLGCAVRGPVVNGKKTKIAIRLSEDTVQRSCKAKFHVVARNNDGHFIPGLGVSLHCFGDGRRASPFAVAMDNNISSAQRIIKQCLLNLS